MTDFEKKQLELQQKMLDEQRATNHMLCLLAIDQQASRLLLAQLDQLVCNAMISFNSPLQKAYNEIYTLVQQLSEEADKNREMVMEEISSSSSRHRATS